MPLSATYPDMYLGLTLAAVIFTVWMTLFMRWWMRNAFAYTPKGVLRHLGKTARVHLKHVRSFEGIWNPSKPLGQDNRLFGPGEATYSIDDHGTVTLEFRVKNGLWKSYTGPVPEMFIHPSKKVVRARKIFRYVLLGYLAVIIVGFMIGYAVAGGTAVHRLIAGGIGALIAMALLWFVVLVLRVGLSVRSLGNGTGDPT